MRFWRRVVLSVVLVLCPAMAVSAQSIEDMAGQMVFVGFTGKTISDPGVRAVREQIAAGQIGGVMFLRTNIASLADVRAINKTLLASRPWLPPLIALDQEGGQIRRLTEAVGFAEIPSARSIGRGSVANALAVYTDLAERLAALGFNVNFGPVVDLDLNPDNPIIARYERAFGVNPTRVVQFAEAFVAGHRAAGLGTALKHFPGHGSSTGDTHEGFVDVTDVWRDVELDPYRQMIADGFADMVMVAHIFNGNLAGDGTTQLPASLSPEWIEGVLRADIGFEGVVISDDMEMGAVRQQFDLHETITRAVMAGNDILLFSNTTAYDPDLGANIHAILVEEARSNPEFAQRVEQSYRRILAFKSRLGN